MEKSSSTAEVVQFGMFTYHISTRTISHSGTGKTSRLPFYPARIMDMLAKKKGRLVGKENLHFAMYKGQKKPWPKLTAVDDTVRRVRSVLDAISDGARGGDYISGTWGEGYRLADEPTPRREVFHQSGGPRGGRFGTALRAIGRQ